MTTMTKIKEAVVKFFFGDTDPRLCALLTTLSFLLFIVITVLVPVESILCPVSILLTVIAPVVVNWLSR